MENGVVKHGKFYRAGRRFRNNKEILKSDEELVKTVLHEMYRLKTSILRGSGTAVEVSKGTKAAFDYAEKAFILTRKRNAN